eukprot:ANDGO_03887.mRNA.1 Thermosome subunit alpha
MDIGNELYESKVLSAQHTRESIVSVLDTVISLLQSSYGPFAFQKAIFDDSGDLMITADGYSIVRYTDWKHPVALLISEAGKSQQDRFGDGSTTAMLWACDVARRFFCSALTSNIPASDWYRKLAALSSMASLVRDYLTSEFAVELPQDDSDQIRVLESVANSVLRTKSIVSFYPDIDISHCIVDHVRKVPPGSMDAFQLVAPRQANCFGWTAEIGTAVLRKRPSILPLRKGPCVVVLVRSDITNKTILFEELAGSSAPVKLALTPSDSALEGGESTRLTALVRDEFQELVKSMTQLGVGLVVCRGVIDPVLSFILERVGIACIAVVPLEEEQILARLLGCSSAPSLQAAMRSPGEYTGAVLGIQTMVPEQLTVGDVDELFTFVRTSSNRVCTFFLGGLSGTSAAEAARAVKSTLKTLDMILKCKSFIRTGGLVLLLSLSGHCMQVASAASDADVCFAATQLSHSLEFLASSQLLNAHLDALRVADDFRLRAQRARPHALEWSSGQWTDDEANAVVEPFQTVLASLESGIRLAAQLLRVHVLLVQPGRNLR